MKQLRIPAVYMRGGTSKGVFFLAHDLPTDAAARDRVVAHGCGDRRFNDIGNETAQRHMGEVVFGVERRRRRDKIFRGFFGGFLVRGGLFLSRLFRGLFCFSDTFFDGGIVFRRLFSGRLLFCRLVLGRQRLFLGGFVGRDFNGRWRGGCFAHQGQGGREVFG